MTQFEKLDLLLRECGGTIQTFQVLNNGISKSVFYAYVKERGLEQAAHGVYVSPDTWTDAMYLLHLRCGQAVFSHETALFFHDLTDREPLKYTITVRTGYNPSRLQEDGFQVYTVKKDLHEIGIIAMQTSFGHSVPVYDMERKRIWRFDSMNTRFTIEEENIVAIYAEDSRETTLENILAAMPYMDEDMRQLAAAAVNKLQAMTDSEFSEREFILTDEE